MEQFNALVLAFFFYSFVGQFWEICLLRFQIGEWRYKGFLRIPMSPIYGLSSLIMISIAQFFQNNPIIIFILSVIVITFAEYLTSLIMEKIFKRTWWDYRSPHHPKIVKKYQFEGRISLPVSLTWGALSLVVVYIIQPHVARFANEIFSHFAFLISAILLIIFAIDTTVSTILNIRARNKKVSLGKINERKNENPRN